MDERPEDLSGLDTPFRKYIIGFMGFVLVSGLFLLVYLLLAPKFLELYRENNDEAIWEKIASDHKKIIELNWELVTPLNDFEIEEIDAQALDQLTSEPRVKVLELGTRMLELANEIEDKYDKKIARKFSNSILKRHKGITLMIEGYVEDDEIKLLTGNQIFRQGRKETLEIASEFGDPADPRYQLIQFLLEDNE